MVRRPKHSSQRHQGQRRHAQAETEPQLSPEHGAQAGGDKLTSEAGRRRGGAGIQRGRNSSGERRRSDRHRAFRDDREQRRGGQRDLAPGKDGAQFFDRAADALLGRVLAYAQLAPDLGEGQTPVETEQDHVAESCRLAREEEKNGLGDLLGQFGAANLSQRDRVNQVQMALHKRLERRFGSFARVSLEQLPVVHSMSCIY